ncbi:hypothetical protein FRC12_003108 [Ceratobasidium sp. 428]|nr:hypothetical protein FRC12_003108 [Ceratobasidium sp. 428]
MTATLRRARANTVGTLAPILAAPTSSSQDDPSSVPIPLGTQSIMSTLVELDMLALEIEVSGGRWIVDRQVLKWWYDAPGEGEPDKENAQDTSARRSDQGCFAGLWWDGGCCEREECTSWTLRDSSPAGRLCYRLSMKLPG